VIDNHNREEQHMTGVDPRTFRDGERMTVHYVPITALDPELRASVEASGLPGGQAVLVGDRGYDDDGTHLLIATVIPDE
jgi:hypothetical protein